MCETEGIPERQEKMFTNYQKNAVEEKEVKVEVKMEVKPASGLEVKRFALDNTTWEPKLSSTLTSTSEAS